MTRSTGSTSASSYLKVLKRPAPRICHVLMYTSQSVVFSKCLRWLPKSLRQRGKEQNFWVCISRHVPIIHSQLRMKPAYMHAIRALRGPAPAPSFRAHSAVFARSSADFFGRSHSSSGLEPLTNSSDCESVTPGGRVQAPAGSKAIGSPPATCSTPPWAASVASPPGAPVYRCGCDCGVTTTTSMPPPAQRSTSVVVNSTHRNCRRCAPALDAASTT
mmetsp:Transcript_29867/g.92175  ORF Transcript_29867/g.92175 Transcript_29867/m.92175 type:complete len:217 (-) Transcript_29867:57-707(-)